MQYYELTTQVADICENTFPTVNMNMFIQQAEQKIYNTVQLPSLRKNVTGAVSLGNPYLSCPSDFLSVYSIAIYPYGGGEYVFLLNKDVNFIREAYPNPAVNGKPVHYALFGPTIVGGSTITNNLSLILGPTPNVVYSTELHYYYYPNSIIQSAINTLGTITGGSDYTNGTYFNVPMTGGTGNNAVATVVVSGGVVISVTIASPGCLFVPGDVLTVAAANLGGTGTGFTVPVATVSNTEGATWLGEHFDSALLNGVLLEALRYMKGEADMITLYKGMYDTAMVQLKQLGDGKERQDMYRSGQIRVQVI